MEIEKPSGGKRLLAVPAVEDQAVERALMDAEAAGTGTQTTHGLGWTTTNPPPHNRPAADKPLEARLRATYSPRPPP